MRLQRVVMFVFQHCSSRPARRPVAAGPGPQQARKPAAERGIGVLCISDFGQAKARGGDGQVSRRVSSCSR